MRLKRPTSLPFLTVILFAGFSAPVFAHPHVFAEARLDVVLSPDGHVASLQHLWRFDDLFSSTVLVEFDKNGDLKLDDSELGEVGQTVKESLAEYGYFQVVTAAGKDVAMNKPDKLTADFKDSQLIILFESTPSVPMALSGKLTFGVYDPTFYTAIDFTEDSYLNAEGLPARCKRTVIRPDPDEALAQNQSTLTDAFFTDPAGTNMSKIFATRLELDCANG